MASNLLSGTVREALPGDKAAVLGIHDDVYGGLDYLPDYYDFFVTSPHITPYVLEENGEIIAYLASCHVDDGRTTVTRAARVRSDKQGQHVYKMFNANIENIQRQGGKVKRHMLVKSETPTDSFLKSYKPVASKAIHMYEFDTSCIHPYQDKVQVCPRLSALARVPGHFLQAGFAEYLFPEKCAIVDWVPYELMDRNLSLMNGKNTVFVCDVINTPNGETIKTDVNISLDKTSDERTQFSSEGTNLKENTYKIKCNKNVAGDIKITAVVTRLTGRDEVVNNNNADADTFTGNKARDTKNAAGDTQNAAGNTQNAARDTQNAARDTQKASGNTNGAASNTQDNTACFSGLLTASTIFRAHHNLDVSCNLDVFGTDLRTFSDHLSFHLQRILETGRVKSVNLRIFTKLCIEKSLIDDFVGRFGIKPEASDRRMKMYIQQDVYERLL